MASLDAQDDSVHLLRTLIQNACVNTGDIASGHEYRSVATLREYLDLPNVELHTFCAAEGRESLVAVLSGARADAPRIGLLGHLDVVPAAPADWSHDPFAADIVDGEVIGRGAVDMLYLTASMAVAFRELAISDTSPDATVVFMAVADEESGGKLGSGWLTENFPELVICDVVLTEWGGVPIPMADGPRLWVTVGQKGGTVIDATFRGRSAHASMPYGSDNALVHAGQAAANVASYVVEPEITDDWRAYVEAMGYPEALRSRLCDPATIDDAIGELSDALAARAHACTRTTLSPTLLHAGTKANVIPDSATLTTLVRRLPHVTLDDAVALFRESLGDAATHAEISVQFDVAPTASPRDTPAWFAIERASQELVPGAVIVPAITAGGNDGGYFRERGSLVYGCGITSSRVTIEDFVEHMHGVDERMDLESYELAISFWQRVVAELGKTPKSLR